MARKLDYVSPPNLNTSGIALLLYIKNLTAKDVGKPFTINLSRLPLSNSICINDGIEIIWQRSIPITDNEILVLIDEKLEKGLYTISINYNYSSVSRTITKYDSSNFTIGIPYSAYPPFELIL